MKITVSAISPLYLILVASCLQITEAVQETIGDRNVVVMRQEHNWYTASEICKSQGMQLLTIRNDEENQEAIILGKKHNLTNFWFGATDLGHENEYVWTDSGLKIGYSRWMDGQPDDSGHDEDCAEINFKWNTEPNVWNDATCKDKRAFICMEVKCKPQKD